MAAVFGNVGADSAEVNDFHINSDVDKSTLAQHHTLGIQANQASPGDHNHDGRNSRKLDSADLAANEIEYTVQGGTLGTQPTFDGDPLFTGHYIKVGSLIHFSVDVDFDNITSFGTGQYFVRLPFSSARAFIVREGCLHDISTGDQYAISGHCAAGSDQLLLYSVASNGRDVAFDDKTPITLSTADNFHIAGVYHAQV